MKNSTKIVAAVIAIVGAAAQTELVQAFVSTHPAVAATLAAVSALSALFHRPTSN